MTLRTKGLKLRVLVGALAFSAASVGLSASPAHADGGHVSVDIGVPVAPAPAVVARPPVVYSPPAYVTPPPLVYATAYVAPPPVVAYPAPVYGGVTVGFGWHEGGWHHHWRR
jgi:hypothetical protein